MKVASRVVRRAFVVVVSLTLASLSLVLPSSAEQGDNCVTLLVPIDEDQQPGPIEAETVDLGCYATYTEAVDVGTAGGTSLPAGASPASLTQGTLAVTTDPDATNVLIGTEYTETNFALSSRSYFAPSTCSGGVIWEVDYVGDNWNDDFESGKGFGGCDANKKFRWANFGGDVLTCTPTCTNYGDLRNEVSSLRWRP
jgi:hypothetical protein